MHDVFLEQLSSGTLKAKRLESQIIVNIIYAGVRCILALIIIILFRNCEYRGLSYYYEIFKCFKSRMVLQGGSLYLQPFCIEIVPHLIFTFLFIVLSSIICLSVCFHLVIVLSGPFRFTTADYLFCIFKCLIILKFNRVYPTLYI